MAGKEVCSTVSEHHAITSSVDIVPLHSLPSLYYRRISGIFELYLTRNAPVYPSIGQLRQFFSVQRHVQTRSQRPLCEG
jgi:hypothetical protein